MNDRAVESSGFAGVVLAGGRSTRMGQDKAELIYRGRTLLAHMLARLQECGAQPIVISGPPRAGHTTLPDQRPGLGPLGGIHAALCGLADAPEINQLLIVPVDMPALSATTLTALVSISPAARACHYADHPLPLGLAVDADVLARLNRLVGDNGLPDSRRSLHAFCASLNAQVLPLPREGRFEFIALNTPADWAAFRADHAGAHVS